MDKLKLTALFKYKHVKTKQQQILRAGIKMIFLRSVSKIQCNMSSFLTKINMHKFNSYIVLIYSNSFFIY